MESSDFVYYLLSITIVVVAIIYYVLHKKGLLNPIAGIIEKRFLLAAIVTIVILALCFLSDLI